MNIKYLIFPFYFLIMIPVEYTLWKEYKKQNKTSKNLIQFVWSRM